PLYAGVDGNGILNITAGGKVTSWAGTLGSNLGSTGQATVTGDGSQWSNTSNLLVGYEGSGMLNVEAGGNVTNFNGFIGYSSGSTGVATVSGSGAQWNNSLNLIVGNSGNGALNIADSGLVHVGGTTSIGASGYVNLTGG